MNVEHLKIIQSVINRMAQVSFVLKGWTVTLVVAILGVAAKSSDAGLSVFALLPAVAFWGLDAYYLRREKVFRELYARVISSEEDGIPEFSMDTRVCDGSVRSWWRILFSRTIMPVHGSVIAMIIIVCIIISQREITGG